MPVVSIKAEALIGIVYRNSVLRLKQLLLFRPTIADYNAANVSGSVAVTAVLRKSRSGYLYS